MEINYHGIEFSSVPAEQQEYFQSTTSSFFVGEKRLRRLFDELSDLVLRRGIGFDTYNGNQPLPECEDILCVVGWPKKDFKRVIQVFEHIANDIEDAAYFGNYSESLQKSAALYRNIRHLVVVTKYHLKM